MCAAFNANANALRRQLTCERQQIIRLCVCVGVLLFPSVHQESFVIRETVCWVQTPAHLSVVKYLALLWCFSRGVLFSLGKPNFESCVKVVHDSILRKRNLWLY